VILSTNKEIKINFSIA